MVLGKQYGNPTQSYLSWSASPILGSNAGQNRVIILHLCTYEYFKEYLCFNFCTCTLYTTYAYSHFTNYVLQCYRTERVREIVVRAFVSKKKNKMNEQFWTVWFPFKLQNSLFKLFFFAASWNIPISSTEAMEKASLLNG